jgi:HlyD family secretion protein
MVVVLAGGLAYPAWTFLRPKGLPEGFAASNGRIEATEVDIAAKLAGRVEKVLVHEGDFISADQVLAKMDTKVLEAERREAESQLRGAQSLLETAQSTVRQRLSEKEANEATVSQREAELDLASKNFQRADQMYRNSAIAKEEFDREQSTFFSGKAALSTAKANVAAAEAAISTARTLVFTAESGIAAAQAKIARIQADIDDSTLKSTVSNGRVQFRIAEPGEVLNNGGKVVNVVDLTDVYMTFFLPEAAAGRVQQGAEVRLVLDAVPQFVIPAKVTFVADVAQFTPKTVETAEERQKLTFRIKAHIPPELLKKYVRIVKTGLPGVAYVQLDPQAEWPANLKVKLPDE